MQITEKERLEIQQLLMGTAALEEAERNPAFKENLYVLLDRYLTEKEDRALFDLPPLSSAAPASVEGNDQNGG